MSVSDYLNGWPHYPSYFVAPAVVVELSAVFCMTLPCADYCGAMVKRMPKHAKYLSIKGVPCAAQCKHPRHSDSFSTLPLEFLIVGFTVEKIRPAVCKTSEKVKGDVENAIHNT